MPLAKVTAVTPEQQFEAEIRATLKRVFPWLPASGLTHQTTFSFTFGTQTITVDGRSSRGARARTDVLVLLRGRPLAVLELKRPGVKLTAEDVAQGLSYGRVIDPRPPLVVLTNGSDTRVLESHTGESWTPDEPSEETLRHLLANAAAVAAADMKEAVGILMGSDPSIWIQAVRGATEVVIAERSGSLADALAPFATGFLLRRKAAWNIRSLLESGQGLVILEGAPLSGKSNALRELAAITAGRPDLAVLYLDADPGGGVFDSLAELLSDALGWPLTPDEARHWLRSLSRAGGPALILAIDNMGAERDNLRRDVEEVTSNSFGAGVRVVLAVDGSVASRLVLQRNGRGVSPLGKRAARLRLGPLDDGEFGEALKVLDSLRIGIMEGGQHSAELRTPWMLRSMCAEVVTAPTYSDETLAAVLPSVPSLDLIAYARDRFDVDEGTFARYRELAQAVLADAQDAGRSFQLILESVDNYVVRRTTAQAHLGHTELSAMLDGGLIREAKSESGDSIYVVRIPELLASEAAKLVAEELSPMARADPAEAAEWLAGAASNLPFGDVVAAQGLVDAAIRDRGMDLRVITTMLERPPRREALPVGARAVARMEGVGVFNMTFEAGGAVTLERGGRSELAGGEPGEPEEHMTYVDFHPWLVLSHLAGHPFALGVGDLQTAPRVDPTILVTVGACPIVLRRPGGDPDVNSVPAHDLSDGSSILCHRAGIVEPITWALFRYLSRETEADAAELIDEVVRRSDPALLARVDVALRELSRSADRAKAVWAEQVRGSAIGPALSAGLASAFVH